MHVFDPSNLFYCVYLSSDALRQDEWGFFFLFPKPTVQLWCLSLCLTTCCSWSLSHQIFILSLKWVTIICVLRVLASRQWCYESASLLHYWLHIRRYLYISLRVPIDLKKVCALAPVFDQDKGKTLCSSYSQGSSYQWSISYLPMIKNLGWMIVFSPLQTLLPEKVHAWH